MAITGEIFDVIVDIRRDSPTFRQWTAVRLSGAVPAAVWVPPGYAHGFYTVSESADVLYKCTDIYVPEDDRGVLWNDPAFDIEWPGTEPLLSPKDRAHLPLDSGRDDLPTIA